MKKKIIALTLIFAMLVPFVPATAAEETAARPTVEEILSQYHQAAFEAEMNGEESAAYSPRAGSNEPTLEQQTVDTLNEAGYEAYNVTADNYDTLEEQLQTDFADMGLDPEGSYIIVIHGEEEQPRNGNARLGDLILPPHEWEPGAGAGGDFEYTYNGITYKMRYVTVTSQNDSNYHLTSDYDLLANYSEAFLDNLLDLGIEAYLNAVFKRVQLGTILSILNVPDLTRIYRTSESVLHYYAATDWNRSYIQVWNSFYEDWCNASCVEYVDMQAKISGYLYNSATGATIDVENRLVSCREYSANYNNSTQRKIDAVIGYIGNYVQGDVVGSITYTLGDKVVAYHHQNF